MFVNFIFCCIVENVECTFSLHFFWKKTFFKKSVSLRVLYQQHNMAFHKGRLGGGQIQILERNGQPPQHQLIHPQGIKGQSLHRAFLSLHTWRRWCSAALHFYCPAVGVLN